MEDDLKKAFEESAQKMIKNCLENFIKENSGASSKEKNIYLQGLIEGIEKPNISSTSTFKMTQKILQECKKNKDNKDDIKEIGYKAINIFLELYKNDDVFKNAYDSNAKPMIRLDVVKEEEDDKETAMLLDSLQINIEFAKK